MPDESTDLDQYERHTIEAVRFELDAVIVCYGGKTFGGILPELLAPGVVGEIRAGAEIRVLTHNAETGWPGQVAHMILRLPQDRGWAELYANY